MQVILATGSIYRREAFQFLGMPFVAIKSEVDESTQERKEPVSLVSTLAELKVMAVAKHYEDAIIIGLDSVGYFKGKILEKPKSRDSAFRRLKELSNQTHKFYTGTYMYATHTKQSVLRVVVTDVTFRTLTDAEINFYLDEDDTYKDMAVGFTALDHLSATFVSRLTGSQNNLIRGIPLEIIPGMFHEMGYNINAMRKKK